MKRVTVLVSGVADNNVHDIQVTGKTLVRDVKAQIGVDDDYWLMVQGSNTILADEEPIYSKVSDGAKIHAVIRPEVD